VSDLGLTLYGVPHPESHTLGADNLQLVFDQIYAKGSDDIYNYCQRQFHFGSPFPEVKLRLFIYLLIYLFIYLLQSMVKSPKDNL